MCVCVCVCLFEFPIRLKMAYVKQYRISFRLNSFVISSSY